MTMYHDGFHERFDHEARLIIMRSLSAQSNYSLNSSMLEAELECWGIAKGRAYVHTQLRYLEQDVSAVRLKDVGSVLIATLTQVGLEHVKGVRILDGIKRPSPGG
ncbi:MAG: hypothetical protein OXR62_10950 [Ahrensia sp.]|nr:hypothetical protein [Ahrensia sp.]